MLLIYRGWGLLAVVTLIPLAVSCNLITVEPTWIFMLAASLALVLAGAVCVYCGTRWNRTGVEHSLYFVSLEVWGWVYLAAAGLFALTQIGDAVKQGLDKPQWLHQGIAGVAGLVVVVAAGVALCRSTRPVADLADSDRKSEPGNLWEHPEPEPGTAAGQRDTGKTMSGNRVTKYVAAICVAQLERSLALLRPGGQHINGTILATTLYTGHGFYPFFCTFLPSGSLQEEPANGPLSTALCGSSIAVSLPCSALLWDIFLLCWSHSPGMSVFCRRKRRRLHISFFTHARSHR